MNSISEMIKINVKTSELKLEDIQEVLNKIKQSGDTMQCAEEFRKYCHATLSTLWCHLEIGLTVFDDQLLCSTCFYTVLTYSNEKHYYLEQVLELIDNELCLKGKGMQSKTMYNTISLIYGLFQSSILLHHSEDSTIAAILEKIFTLLTLMAYEYSQYTFITFKIMTFFKKTKGSYYQGIIFNNKNNLKLLHVINHNWENPITGVRNLNKIIFHNMLIFVDKDMYECIKKYLNKFYWNKAKYLMFAEIIELHQGNIQVLINEYGMIEGLIYSLEKAGLVSAGTDMYFSIVNKLNTDDEWCNIFLSYIKEIIKRSSIKLIENFCNYWCLNTLKKFPSLTKTLFENIETMISAKHALYSCLSIMQQSNRLKLLEKDIACHHIEEIILRTIEHSDVRIRMLSFDIACGVPSKRLPEQKDYNLILEYLENNVNSDCSVLRINMIKCFQNFLIQLHIKFVNNQITKDLNVEGFLSFIKNLQLFIIKSLNFNGNYQRKIATILVIKAMLDIFKEIPRKQKKGTNQTQEPILCFLINRDQWIMSEKQFILKLISLLKDPSDDIREQAMNILLYHYPDQLCKYELISYLTKEAKLCLKSRFFYQITCGQTIFKLVVKLLFTKHFIDSQFKTVEDIFMFAYDIVKSEHESKMDIVKSIDDGKQLHSYLSILYIIFEVCIEKSHRLSISMNVISSLIDVLKSVANQFAWDQETSVSSDFSKMSEMVEDMITNSEHKIRHQNSDTNISGLHQIVLNCLWLNVKASCEVSSILIRYYQDDSHAEICEQCLITICHVLETSRHKGAIETGGAALGKAIQQMTLAPVGSKISTIPMLLLQNKFRQLLSETSTMASVTRRGAGLSIMIHRIVSNDMKKAKPLFHYFIQALLDTCEKLPESCITDIEDDTSNEKDLPKAIYIHFLTKIVIDSSLASDVMYYSAQLAELAFNNLSSSCWQIRNAALQLYGSLIPKLIGQKKNSGVSDEVMATVAVDEFRTHSPKLWDYIETQLKFTTKTCKDVIHHNNLVPTLSVLANLAPFYSFASAAEYNKELLSSLISLLGSPIYFVRRLTSKCILNLFPLEKIYDVLLSITCETENCLHGTLALLYEFVKQCNTKEITEKAATLQDKYHNILIKRKFSFICKERFEHTFPECLNLTELMIKETISEINQPSTAPGLFLWANFRIQHYLENISWESVPNVVKAIADCSDFKTYCETLCRRIRGDRSIPEDILLELCSILLSLGFKKRCTTIWRTLYEISLQVHTQSFSGHIETPLLYKHLVDNKVSFRMRHIIAFAARIFKDDKELSILSDIILSLCNPENAAVEMRLTAAIANNEIACSFSKLSDYTKLNTIKAAVMFLQDEEEDVRNLSVQFYRQVIGDEIATHPYICMKKMLNSSFLHTVLSNAQSGILSICIDLESLLKSLCIKNDDEYNPFASDSKNIYMEPDVLSQLLGELKIFITE